ncbi:hypothetical protein GKODMF_11450 [Candidatus Electrothrix gigas]
MSLSSVLSPFVAGPMIKDPSLFVGRKEELRILAGRMSGVQPVSVNVIGERRIGKSSLLYHFLQTWEQRVDSPNRFVVVYLDLQDETPSNEIDFYQALGRALARSPLPASYKEFRTALDTLFAQNLLPVFCLDEFEVLLKNNEQFTDSFFDQLRGCMNASQLMFILSSRQPLDVYAGKQNLTSDFFNLGQVVELGEFSEEEVEELLHLPLPGRENFPALSPGDQKLARQWGNRHPYLLQLAATALVEARQFRKNTAWAKKRFAKEHTRLKKEGLLTKPRSLTALLDSGLGALKKIAEAAGYGAKILLFLVLLALLVGVIYGLLTGQLTWTAAGEWFLKLIGK